MALTVRVMFEVTTVPADGDDHELGRATVDSLDEAGTVVPRLLRELADQIEGAGIGGAATRKPLVKWTPGLQAAADQMAMPADEPREMQVRQEPFAGEQGDTPSS